jgi:hypothetical protein
MNEFAEYNDADMPEEVLPTKVNVLIANDARHDDLVRAFQSALATIALNDATVIPHTDDPNNTILVRRFTPNLYTVTGYRLPNPGESANGNRLLEFQRNPPEDMVQSGTYLPICFQEGRAEDVGVNGITMEALLMIVHDRLSLLNQGAFECHENDSALYHIAEAIDALNLRMARVTKERTYVETLTPDEIA